MDQESWASSWGRFTISYTEGEGFECEKSGPMGDVLGRLGCELLNWLFSSSSGVESSDPAIELFLPTQTCILAKAKERAKVFLVCFRADSCWATSHRCLLQILCIDNCIHVTRDIAIKHCARSKMHI